MHYFSIQKSIVYPDNVERGDDYPHVLQGVKAESHVLAVRWMVKRGGEAAQLGLFKREMDRGSDLGTNIPLQRAHNSASICTSPSFTAIHHSLTASTSCFHLTSHYPHLFLPNLSQTDAQMGFRSFLSTQHVIHLSWRSISCCCICREHTGRGACADIGRPWVDVSVDGSKRNTVDYCSSWLQQAWQAL